MEVIEKNSEMLFLYDAKMSNPNGDMDNENKPRMDYDTNTNLVSDVRLKRYLRDYFEKQLGMPIFVTTNAKDAKDRGSQLKNEKLVHEDLIDCKLFGVVKAETGANSHFTGPVQFNWGYSLNKVELNESTTITSSFSSGQGVGKDFRVKYSLIAFNGSINASTAKSIPEAKGPTEEDIALFDRAMINAIPFGRTRSKMGQTPRLYLRVELTNGKTFLKDLREFISCKPKIDDEYKVRTIDELSIDVSQLGDYLEKNKKRIHKIYYWIDEGIAFDGWDNIVKRFKDSLEKIEPSE